MSLKKINKTYKEHDIDFTFEHKFWLQIIGDHLRFILTSLDPREILMIESTTQLIEIADQLLDSARENQEITAKAKQLVLTVSKLKKEILLRHIKNNIRISLPPTFINHMLNEIEEYDKILNGQVTKLTISHDHILNAHNLWLKDAAGHAEAIAIQLDSVEKEKILELLNFRKDFKILHTKCDEFIGYLRAGINDFPALHKLNDDSALKILLFVQVLNEIMELRLEKMLLGSVAPLFLDHMIREECYYLNKIYQTQQKLGMGAKAIPFDPTSPRIEN